MANLLSENNLSDVENASISRDNLDVYSKNEVKELFSSSEDGLGDALIGVRQPFTGAVGRTQHDKNLESVSIMDFGAVGDGVEDDSKAFNAALSIAKDSGCGIFFPQGKYNLPSTDQMSGRIFLYGNGDVDIIGALVYSDIFPASADDPDGVVFSSPFISITGINFSNESVSEYALTVIAQGGSSFIDCMSMSFCKFYGKNGFLAKNLISVTISHCWFYSLLIGFEAQGCINWNVMNCWFRNSRQCGASITYNPDYNNRKGGENLRFTNCEFAVCCKGIYAFRNVWLNVDNCLFDYNTLPVELHGSYYAKISNSYLGAANQSSLSEGAGFIAPATIGCSFYAHPADADDMGSASYCGVTVVNCEMVNYLSGTSLPVAYVEGALASLPAEKLAERVVFIANKFIMSQSHSATSLLSISSSSESMVCGNSFISYNLSTTLIAPYVSTNSDNHNGVGNLNEKCVQSDEVVPLAYDYQTSVGLRGVSGTGMWIQDIGGTNKIGVNASNRVALLNADVASDATAGSYALPSGALGFVIISINGGNVKIPYYAI